jgi:regulatory protein
MVKITEISPQQKAPHRVNIFVDEVFKFGLDERLLLDFDLYVGKEISNSDIEKFKEGDSYQKCMEKAFRFLSFRMRSEKEMRDKLLEKYDAKIVEKAIEKLKDLKYVNDIDFARAWVESRKVGRGKRALSFELSRKGVTKEIIDEALLGLSGDEEFESALDLVKKKSKYKNLDRNEAYQKIGGFLSRRGYSYDIIKKIINKKYNK